MNNLKRLTGGIIGIVVLLFFAFTSAKWFEDVDANEIVVIQDPFDGDLHVYTTPGVVGQYWGRSTHYRKSYQYWFDGKEEHAAPIPIKFYDGGHATIPGSIRVDMPLDEASIIKNHIKFGSQEAIEKQLIGQVLSKSVYMAGPIMTSKESYAEKKNDLLYYVEDQATHGVYKTRQKEVKIVDNLTGQERLVTAVEIVTNANGTPFRQEASLVAELGIKLNNLSFGDFNYDEVVKKQIANQQNAIMQVQTAMANAKRAEQDAITVEQQGKADATKAKWEQEVIKAQQVTKAEQELAVQTLNTKKAELYKQQQILEGQGDAEKKRLVMQANGALEQKLDTYQKVQEMWASAFANYKGAVVPTTVMGGNSGSGNASVNFMDLITAKTAKDLSLDLTNKQ